MLIEETGKSSLRIVVVKGDDAELLRRLVRIREISPKFRIGSDMLPCYVTEYMPGDTIYILAPEPAA